MGPPTNNPSAGSPRLNDGAIQPVDGPSLAEARANTSWSNRDAAILVRDCALALQNAHERGIVHGRLEPCKILLKPKPEVDEPTSDPASFDPQITGLGLPTGTVEEPSSHADGIRGTPSYMAPEQANFRYPVGPAADIHALGAILYELLVGRPPFRADTPMATVLQVVADDPVPPSRLQPKVPRDLESICLKCLAKQPDRRYHSARELANDLDRFLNYQPIQARPSSHLYGLRASVRKRPWAVVGAAVAIVLVVSLIVQGFYLDHRRQRLSDLYQQARLDRLSLAEQSAPAPRADGSLRPVAQDALQALREAAHVRPESRLYREALDLLLVEHRGGERAYPKPGSPALLPHEWASGERSFPWPFILTKDAGTIQVRDFLLDPRTGSLTRFRAPGAPREWNDPTGTLLVRRFKPTALEIRERASGKTLLRVDPEPLAVWTPRFSPDGRLLALVLGAPGRRFVERDVRALEVWDIRAGRQLATIPLPERRWPGVPVFSGDSRFLAWLIADQVEVYASTTGKLISRVAAPNVARAVLSPDGSLVAWTTSVSNSVGKTRVHVVRVADGQRVHDLSTAGPVALVHLAFTPDGRFILGQTGYRDRDYVYKTIGRTDPRLAPVFQEHSNRICIWDTTDGKLMACLWGRAFAQGFGPHDEIAVARTVGAGDDAEPAIDLLRPGELVQTLKQEGLVHWAGMSDFKASAGGLSGWVFALSFAVVWWPLTWYLVTLSHVQQNRITVRAAVTGLVWTLLCVTLGIYLCDAVIAQLPGHWPDVFHLKTGEIPLFLYALMGLIYLLLASVVGGLAMQCYVHAAQGEPVPFFAQLQQLPHPSEAEKKQHQKRGREFLAWYVGAMLAMIGIFWLVAWVDGSALCTLLTNAWPDRWLTAVFLVVIIPLCLLVCAVALLWPLYLIFIVADARWGPVKQPWLILPAGMPRTAWRRFALRLFNLFPLSRRASVLFQIVILLMGLTVAGVFLQKRLAGGGWPRSSDAHDTDVFSTLALALAFFYVIFSLARLLRIELAGSKPAGKEDGIGFAS